MYKKILLKFPTRERPEIFLGVLDKYLNLADDKENLTVLVSADVTDNTMNNEKMFNEIRSRGCNISIENNHGKIQAINEGMHLITDWDIVLLASDDMIPQVQGYDNIIRKHFEANFPNGDGAIWLNDGKTFDTLNTIVLMDKKRYERFGYLYHPSYWSLWPDNEYTDVNLALGMPYVEQVIIKNESPDWNGSNPMDNLYRRNNNRKQFDKDKLNYERRKKLGFPA